MLEYKTTAMATRGEDLFLGAAIRVRRKALGLTQEDLARRSGSDQTAISKIELGRTPQPSAEVVLRIARALDTTVEDLYGGSIPLVEVSASLAADDETTQPAMQIAELQGRLQQLEATLYERTQDLAETTKTANMALKLAKRLRDELKSARRVQSA